MNFLKFAGSHEKILRRMLVLFFFFVLSGVASAQVLLTQGLNAFPEIFENYPVTITVGEHAPAENVVAAVSIAMTLQNVTQTETATATGFEDVFRKSVVSVGNACNNPVTADLLGFIEGCKSAVPNNTAIIKLIALPFEDRYAMVVAGSTEQLTKLAAQVLAEHDTFLAGMASPEVQISGTSLSDVVITEIPQQQMFFMRGFVNYSLDVRNANVTQLAADEYRIMFTVLENNSIVSNARVTIIPYASYNASLPAEIVYRDTPVGAVNFDNDIQFISALAFFSSAPANIFFITQSHAVLAQKFNIVQNNATTGELYFMTKLFEIPSQPTTFALTPEGMLAIDATNFQVEFNAPDFYQIHGNVVTLDGKPLRYGEALIKIETSLWETVIYDGIYSTFMAAWQNDTVTVTVENETKSKIITPENLEKDEAHISSYSDLFEINETIGNVRPTLTEFDLDMLKGGFIEINDSWTRYFQSLDFISDESFNSGKVVFGEDERDVVGNYLFWDDGSQIFEWQLYFSEGLQSEIVGDDIAGIEGRMINILGTDFTIADTDIEGSQLAIELMTGAVIGSWEANARGAFVVDGKDYDVEVVQLSGDGDGQVQFNVNGQLTDVLEEGNVTLLADGQTLGVLDIDANKVTFAIGAQSITFNDDFADTLFQTAGTTVNGKVIEDSATNIKGSRTDNTIEIQQITYQLLADAVLGDLYVPPGSGVRAQLDEPEGMLANGWDITYNGLSNNESTRVVLDPTGNNTYDLEFTNQEGIFYDMPLLVNDAGNLRYGDQDDDLLFCEGDSVSIGDFFVLSDCSPDKLKCFTHILKYDHIDRQNRVLTFTDVGTGPKDTSFDAATGKAEIITGGITYAAFVNQANDNLSIDLSGDGRIENKCVRIGTQGEALLAQGGGSPLRGTFLLTTSINKFDERQSSETISFDFTQEQNKIKLSVNPQIYVGSSMFGPFTPEGTDKKQYMSIYGVFFEEQLGRLSIDYPLKQKTADVVVGSGKVKNSIRIDFVLPKNTTENNYADSDNDGVPDWRDKCPDSKTTVVDYRGCSCEQLRCEQYNMSCATDVFGPRCKATCDDGIQNQREEGIDCGVQVCGKPCCSPANTCLEDKPLFCGEKNEQVPNCQQCGCPEEFTCGADGECVKEVAQEGIKCKMNEYKTFSFPYDCSSLGSTWVQENQMNYFRVRAGGMFASKVRSAVNRVLRQFTVCINTQKACVAPETKCPAEDKLMQYLPDAHLEIQAEVNKNVRKILNGYPGFIARLKIDVVNLENFKIRETYNCPNITITPQTGCRDLITNGPAADKADILFIGDRFYDPKELEAEINKEIDFTGENAGTSNEGLFSIEPFKSAKDKFNIKYLLGKNEIGYVTGDAWRIGYGYVPSIGDIMRLASRCTEPADYVVALSKASYRSGCYYGTPCFDSVLYARSGRLLLHEFGGHGFASVGDEYHNLVELKDADGRVEEFIPKLHTGKNCKETIDDARTAWGDLLGGPVGFFNGCGGDCTEQCSQFVRPTLNSVMRDQDQKAGTECWQDGRRRPTPDCLGPPFDPYYAVNEREIKKVLETYK